MTKPKTIGSNLSWVPLQVKTHVGDKLVGLATGFFYVHKEVSFFITNRHVVTGCAADGTIVSSTPTAMPESLSIRFPYKFDKGGTFSAAWAWQEFPLYDDGEPAWVEHPVHGRDFDVVALPVTGMEASERLAVLPANAPTLDLDAISLYPSMDAFVLGFPEGLTGGGLAIWKRATIASEPDLDIGGLPKFYVDTATRKGMSGSPVYVREAGGWMPEGKTELADMILGKGQMFVGVYASRINADDELLAQLGVVWKASALVELLDAAPAVILAGK